MKIDFSKLNQQQIDNFKSAIDAYNSKKLTSSVKPSILYIELTRNCIAKCAFCKGPNFVNKPSYNMSGEIFDILLRNYIPYCILVDLRAYGESLMLPDFGDYVEKIARLKPMMRLTTTLGCGNRKALQSIIDYDIFVSVTIDAAQKKVYESIRKGINYNIVIRNLEFLIKGILRKHGSLEDRIRLAIIPLQRDNLNHVESVFKLAERYGIPEIRIGPLSAPAGDKRLLEHHQRKTIKILRKCVQYAKRTGIRLQLSRPPFPRLYIKEKSFDLCCHPWLYAQVDYEGNFFYCDHMLGQGFKKYLIGNVKVPEGDPWNDIEMQKVRLTHLTKDWQNLVPRCKRCYQKGRYADHEHELEKQFTKWNVTENDIENKLLPLWKKIFRL